MAIFFVFFILIAIAITTAFLLNTKFEIATPIAFMFIIALLYFFAVLGILQIGVYSCLGLILAGFVFTVIKGKKEFWQNQIFTLGFFVFLLILIVTWWAHRSRLFTEWDEFSHWGLSVKAMFTYNALPNARHASIYFPDYPPATALFHYFFAKLYGSFTEGNVYRSINILSFSLLLPLFSRFSFKNYKNTLVVLILSVFTPLLFTRKFYTTTYVDAFLGLLMAYIIYLYYTAGKSSPLKQINICLSLFVLSITKASGSGLAFIACLIFLADIIISNRKQLKPKVFIQPLFYFAATLLGYFSWKIYLLVNATSPSFVSSFSSEQGLISLLSGNAEEYKYSVIRNFFTAIFTTQYQRTPYNLTLIAWGIIFAILMYFVYKQAENKALTKNIFIAVGIGSVIYLATLLFAYLGSFSQYEALNLASLERYLSTYFTATAFVLIFIYADTMPIFTGKGIKTAIAPIMVCALLVAIAPVENLNCITFNAKASIKSSEDLRIKDLALADKTKGLNPAEDKIYYIEQGARGFGRIQAKYLLYPIFVEGGSLGTPYGEGDIWTVNMTCEHWQEQLLSGNYTYVYINSCDGQFISEFGNAFENKKEIDNESLYKINITNGKAMLSLT